MTLLRSSDCPLSRVLAMTFLASTALWSLGPEATETATASEPTATRTAASAPLAWTEIRSELFISRPPRAWMVAVEETEPGTVGGRPLRQTRLRFTLRDGKERRDLAYLQHTDNQRLEWLAPGDPRLTAAPVLRDDARDPWPNVCGVDFAEMRDHLDLDGNAHNELVVRFMSTVDAPGASGLLLVQSDSLDRPTVLSLEAVTAEIRMDEVTLTDVVVPEGKDPILVTEWRPLDQCRFLLMLGLDGEPACEDCCRFPVVLVQGPDRRFHPNYDRSRHQGYLERLEVDLGSIAGRAADAPLASRDQAALGRAAAFFYLTGQGARTKENLASALGERSRQSEVQSYLERLEHFFLSEPPPAATTPNGTQPGTPPGR